MKHTVLARMHGSVCRWARTARRASSDPGTVSRVWTSHEQHSSPTKSLAANPACVQSVHAAVVRSYFKDCLGCQLTAISTAMIHKSRTHPLTSMTATAACRCCSICLWCSSACSKNMQGANLMHLAACHEPRQADAIPHMPHMSCTGRSCTGMRTVQ